MAQINERLTAEEAALLRLEELLGRVAEACESPALPEPLATDVFLAVDEAIVMVEKYRGRTSRAGSRKGR